MRYICFVTEIKLWTFVLSWMNNPETQTQYTEQRLTKQTENQKKDYLRTISERRDLIYISVFL